MTSPSCDVLPSEQSFHPAPRLGGPGPESGIIEKQSLRLPEDVPRKTSIFDGGAQNNREDKDFRDSGEDDGTQYNSRLDLEASSKHKKEQSNTISEMHPASIGPGTYPLTRYVPRAILNSLGPILVTAFYCFIVFVYILRPSVNDVIPGYPINAKGAFFAWFILSIFVLDWSKSALAGFEASALMKRGLAPRSAQGLMWHADRGWGSLIGWWKAFVVLYSCFRHDKKPTSKKAFRGPGVLWYYLAMNGFMLYATIPLAGLSMDISEGYERSDDKVSILGANETSFDYRSSNGVAEEASSRWRQGNPTSPHGETIFYAASGTKSVNSTYFEDSIQAIYSSGIANQKASASAISGFSGPQVSERVHGRAWGLLTNITCEVAHPYKGLCILNVSSIDDWSCHDQGISSNGRFPFVQPEGGKMRILLKDGSSQGLSYVYLIGTDSASGIADNYRHTDEIILPNNGNIELVMWQAYRFPFTFDEIFRNLLSDPSVVSSFRALDSTTYRGYGIRCSVNSSVGFADLDAGARTYSSVTTSAATRADTLLSSYYGPTQSLGILTIQNIVYGAFTTMVLGNFSLSTCPDDGTGRIECGLWYGASAATGASYEPVNGILHLPIISPARMKLAIYKLFGETAIAMMASGGGQWTGELYGLKPANDLVPGFVPWQLVVCLLGLWMFITVLPSVWTMGEKRWAVTLDGLERFRLGAEWKEAVREFEGAEIGECESLQTVPGMVGDMDVMGKVGFIGLSRDVARREGRLYAFAGGPAK